MGGHNNFISKNFRPEPPPSVDRPKMILFQHGTRSEMKENYFKEFYFNMHGITSEVK